MDKLPDGLLADVASDRISIRGKIITLEDVEKLLDLLEITNKEQASMIRERDTVNALLWEYLDDAEVEEMRDRLEARDIEKGDE